MELLNLYPCYVSLKDSSGGPQFEMESYDLNIVNKIEFLGNSIDCLFKLKTGDRFLRYQGSIYNSVQDIIYFFPELANSTLIIAKLLNFFFSNNSDQVIEIPQTFIEKYNLLYTSDFIDNPNNHLSAYNHYDISPIKSPRIKNQKLIYYVDRKGIPYKVSCEWPITSTNPDLKYETLNSID